MSSSLLTGVSGLRIHQEMLDVVGNNLANSNTTGFKSQRTSFSDLVYQTLSQASPSTDTVGGTDPLQIGLGARVASVDPDNSQGALQATGRDLDMSLQGNGYFVARNGTENVFTRDGAFGVDSHNYLVDPSTGYRIQRFGTVGEGTATSPAFQVAGNNDLKIPIGTGIPGNPTSNIVLQGNLTANATGPLTQTLTSAGALTSGAAPADASTLLSAMDDSTGGGYTFGDQLQLQGITAGNATVNTTIPVDNTTTVGDLLSAIDANFPGSTSSIDATGNLVITDNTTGVTGLKMSLSDVTGNVGGLNWANHVLATTTTGKDGDIVRTGIQVYDPQGTAHTLNMVFQKQSTNVWNLTTDINPSEGTVVDNLVSNINFNEDGSFRQVSGVGLGDPAISIQFNGFAGPQAINFNFGAANGFNGLTQVGGASSAVATGQDGFEAGFLTTVAISQDGVLNGTFTNGRTLALAQLGIASFANPAALNRIGDNYYALTSESGPALLGAGLSGGRGSVQQKTLESSNVDVSLEFTRLIIAQRGYEVNARVITASDQILQDLTNIIR